MSTNTLFETLYQLLVEETQDKYLSQSVEAMDTLLQNKDTFSNLHRETSQNTKENREQFLALFQEINAAEVIPETMKALGVFLESLSKQKL